MGPDPQNISILSVEPPTDAENGLSAEDSVPCAGRTEDDLSSLRLFVDSLADPVYVVSLDVTRGHRFALTNAAFATYADRKATDLVGETPQDVFGGTLGAEMAGRWSDAAEAGKPINYTATGLTAVGARAVSVTLSRLLWPGGADGYLIGVIRDVTDSVRANDRLATLFRHATEGVLMARQDGLVTEVCLGGAEIWGLSDSDVVGRNLSELVHPEDRGLSNTAWRRAVSVPGEPVSFQVRSRRSDDEWGWVNGMICDLCADPSVGAVVVALRDSDEQKRAEDRLRATEARLASLVANASEALVGIDPDQNIVLWNRAAEAVFGYADDEILGRSLTLLLPEATRGHHHELVQGFADTGIERTRMADRAEVEAVRKNGEVFPAEVQIAKIPIEDGLMLMASVRDVSARRHAELATAEALADLEATQAELLQAQKLESVGQLAAGIAHEINTPMQYIGDNAHFLKAAVVRLLDVAAAAQTAASETASAEDQTALVDALKASKLSLLAERAPKAADDALAGVETVSRIVTAMKRFSHPGSDDMEAVDLCESITTTLTVCHNEWKYSAEITTDFGENMPTIEGHLGQLNQVWLNLIVNATHAVSDRHGETMGRIDIVARVAPAGDAIEVSIADNGAGISAANTNRIFDPFFTTKEVGKGTGQGLAIAHQVIVKQHNGTIAVDSVVDHGTTFTITLPITQPPTSQGKTR